MSKQKSNRTESYANIFQVCWEQSPATQKCRLSILALLSLLQLYDDIISISVAFALTLSALLIVMEQAVKHTLCVSQLP